MTKNALSRAIQLAGGPAELARKLNISSQAVSQWPQAPDRRVLQIEAATGGQVSRYELRPDLYPNEGQAV